MFLQTLEQSLGLFYSLRLGRTHLLSLRGVESSHFLLLPFILCCGVLNRSRGRTEGPVQNKAPISLRLLHSKVLFISLWLLTIVIRYKLGFCFFFFAEGLFVSEVLEPIIFNVCGVWDALTFIN